MRAGGKPNPAALQPLPTTTTRERMSGLPDGGGGDKAVNGSSTELQRIQKECSDMIGLLKTLHREEADLDCELEILAREALLCGFQTHLVEPPPPKRRNMGTMTAGKAKRYDGGTTASVATSSAFPSRALTPASMVVAAARSSASKHTSMDKIPPPPSTTSMTTTTTTTTNASNNQAEKMAAATPAEADAVAALAGLFNQPIKKEEENHAQAPTPAPTQAAPYNTSFMGMCGRQDDEDDEDEGTFM